MSKKWQKGLAELDEASANMGAKYEQSEREGKEAKALTHSMQEKFRFKSTSELEVLSKAIENVVMQSSRAQEKHFTAGDIMAIMQRGESKETTNLLQEMSKMKDELREKQTALNKMQSEIEVLDGEKGRLLQESLQKETNAKQMRVELGSLKENAINLDAVQSKLQAAVKAVQKYKKNTSSENLDRVVGSLAEELERKTANENETKLKLETFMKEKSEMAYQLNLIRIQMGALKKESKKQENAFEEEMKDTRKAEYQIDALDSRLSAAMKECRTLEKKLNRDVQTHVSSGPRPVLKRRHSLLDRASQSNLLAEDLTSLLAAANKNIDELLEEKSYHERARTIDYLMKDTDHEALSDEEVDNSEVEEELSSLPIPFLKSCNFISMQTMCSPSIVAETNDELRSQFYQIN